MLVFYVGYGLYFIFFMQSQATNFKAIMEGNPDSEATATDIIVLLVQDR